MYRGILDSLNELAPYANAKKTVTIELQQWQQTWLHAITEPHSLNPEIDTGQITRDSLKSFKNTVKDNFNKKFIYFICSRTRVRFNPKKQPHHTFFRKKIKIHLIIEERTYKTIILSKDHPILVAINPSKITVTEENITFYKNDHKFLIMDIHKFLMDFHINLNISNRVEYVGLTINPEKRPTDLNHAGLSRTLSGHAHRKEVRDCFIYHHIFKVLVISNPSVGIDIVIGNGWTDEINIDTEADIIEKSFILYFGSDYQKKTATSDNSNLTNKLKELLKNSNIEKIEFRYEFDDCSRDYASFYSDKTSPATIHHFSIILQDDILIFKNME